MASTLASVIKSRLAHPLTKGMSIDDPHTTLLRRQIIREKAFLRHIYEEWYAAIAAALPAGEGPVLELGSGPGFMSEFIPGLITSEVLFCPGVKVVVDGCCLPFPAGALRAILMLDVLHHLPQPRRFFQEAAGCVRPGGVVMMTEPWVSPWSRFVYERLHYEPFHADAPEWECPNGGPLSGANDALPWIIFERDRNRFEREFPEWELRPIRLHTPFRYLFSGGVTMRTLMPGLASPLFRWLERGIEPWMGAWAMFATITLLRTGRSAPSTK